MLPYKSIIEIKKNTDTPIYIQIANRISSEIRSGLIKPGVRLPSTREFAILMKVNRNTILAAYTELNLQGYIEMLPKKGVFVSTKIPEVNIKKIASKRDPLIYPENSGFTIEENPTFSLITRTENTQLEFNDGLPDERIAPLTELLQSYRSIYKRGGRIQFGYTEAEGNLRLRQEISLFVNETRGLHTTFENIMITKGSQMAIFLVSQLLLKKGDMVVVGETNYLAADHCFKLFGARLERVPIDNLGLVTDALEELCRKKPVRAIYVTPHHHFPTTVTMSACRRMRLMELAEKYRFAIIEDDYDYDFHYKSAPILPLASVDGQGLVINIGSFSKNFAPSLRLGYLVAPKNTVQKLSSLRFLIDRQGDYLLEQALAELFKEGVLKRHLRKALNIYRERRDFLTEQLESKLGEKLVFKVPDGGLAIWGEFDKSVSINRMAEHALRKGLKMSALYQRNDTNINGTRLGFASLNFEELEKAVTILKEVAIGGK